MTQIRFSTFASVTALALLALVNITMADSKPATLAAPAPTAARVLADAAAVWHVADTSSADGKSPLTPRGNARAGVDLVGADREASLARGGDGKAAELAEGSFHVSPKAADALNLDGETLTLLIRLRATGEFKPGELFCRHGGHDRLVFNIYSIPSSDGGILGFEMGIEGIAGLSGVITVPWKTLVPTRWHDIAVRYDGKIVVMFVDGIVVGRRPATGRLRQGNTQPIVIGSKAFTGLIDHAAIWKRALTDDEIIALASGPGGVAQRREEISKQIEASIGREGLTLPDQLRGARELRQRLWNDPYRPRYHLLPPDGFWNDINGTIFWKGRYHVFFLGRLAPDRDTILSGKDTAKSRETWIHASSRDLVHWIHHPPALVPVFDGSMPSGIFSGDMMDNMPIPTIIVHVPGQGTCLFMAEDDELIRWKPFPGNPVIPQPKDKADYTVFDPCGWREGKFYYALIGNKNRTPGYEGDSTSLFRSTDLKTWEYRGPFYKSQRKWTDEIEDCACPDFFPLGNKHMLLMHTHRPYGQAQYYIGRYENERFDPEVHGRMTWPGGNLCAPETLKDEKGRRIFWGWMPEGRGNQNGWGSVASLPRVLSLADDNTLRIEPAPELESLRLNPRQQENITVAADTEKNLDDIRGDTLELMLEIDPGDAKEFGLAVRCAPDGGEQTPVICSPADKTLAIDRRRSSVDPSKPRAAATGSTQPRMITGADSSTRLTSSQQTAPFELRPGEHLKLRVFIDRSVLEVFANDRQCLSQRIYPQGKESLRVKLFARGGSIKVKSLRAWDMEQVNSW